MAKRDNQKGTIVAKETEVKEKGPKEAVDILMSRFKAIYSGHEDLALDVFKRIIGHSIGVKEENRPVGTYLIIGPSGSGKSYFWECIAESIHMRRNALLTIDGGEYMHSHEIAKLIGAPPGYLGHRETSPIFSPKNVAAPRGDSAIIIDIVLVDEVDKAHELFTNALIGLLQKGHIRLGDNTKTDMSNSLVVLTSNSGGEVYNDKSIGLSKKTIEPGFNLRKKLLKEFSAPFLNRIDVIQMFDAYGEAEKMTAMKVQVKRLLEDIGDHRRSVSVSDDFFIEMMKIKLDKHFGMRDLVRKMKSIIRSRCIDIAMKTTSSKVIDGDAVKEYLRTENEPIERLRANTA